MTLPVPRGFRFLSRAAGTLAGVSMLCACASSGVAPGTPPSDTEIAALQNRLGADSSRVDLIVRLGEAYQRQGRRDELVALMERAVTLNPRDSRLVVLLGIAYEDEGSIGDAIEIYRTYVLEGNDAPTRRRLTGRIRVLEREQLIRTVRQSLANEASLPAPAGQGTLAVFPFLLQAQDSTLDPLSRAIAELLVTDLSQTDRLQVLERMHVQALLEEMRLAEAGLVDPATAARGGKLLGAGQIVQGSVGGTEQDLQLNAAVVGVSTGQPQVQTAQGSSPLARFFDAEKALALDIYRALGIELTPAERERVNGRPTENIRALLLFGLGLEAEDLGNYQIAANYFSQAASMDPSFAMARSRAVLAQQAADAAGTSTTALWEATGFLMGDPFAAVTSMIPPLTGRDAVSELYGLEGLTGQGSVLRILLREGGSDE